MARQALAGYVRKYVSRALSGQTAMRSGNVASNLDRILYSPVYNAISVGNSCSQIPVHRPCTKKWEPRKAP